MNVTIGFIKPNANWDLIPTHCQESLSDYILYGAPVGSFLTAVLSNDLRGATAKADDDNLPALRGYVVFLYNYASGDCWGSPQKHLDWLQRGREVWNAA